MIIYKYLTSVEIFNVILTLICHVLCFYIGFKSTLKSSIFHGLILAITQFISEVVAIYIISWLSGLNNTSYTENMIIYIIDVIMSKILWFLISRFLLRFSIKENSSKSWGRWFSLSVLPISSLFIIIVVRLFTNDQIFSLQENVLCISSISALLISNIVVYLIYEKAEKSNQKLIELELSNQKDNINMQYLGLLEKKNEQMQIITHDYKNNILTIADMTDSVEIKEYINSMVGEIKKYNQIAKTKNKLLDIILNKYTDMCEAAGILFDVNVSTDNLDFISNYDISSLFNNILDNAYEAALKSKQKNIYLEISRVLGSYHKIIVRNSSDFQPKTHNDKLISTKTYKESHGFGTKSIQKVVNKYHGELQWDYDDNKKEFKLIILFPDSNIN